MRVCLLPILRPRLGRGTVITVITVNLISV